MIRDENLIANRTIKDQEIKSNMRILLSKFIDIRNQGYIESIRTGSTGVGITFETLLGKKEDSKRISDYYGIEIKTKRAYSKSFVSLFGMAPRGKTTNEVRRLVCQYGYIYSTDSMRKHLYSNVRCNELCRTGIYYYFKLRLDKENKKLILQIYNKNKILINEDSFWYLNEIKKLLYKKLKYLAYIKSWRKFISGKEYFKYFDIKFYVLKDFDQFIKLLEQGHIRVMIAINSFVGGECEIKAHKIAFEIDPNYLMELFYLYEINEDIVL